MAGPDNEGRLAQGWKLVRDGYANSDDPRYEQTHVHSSQEHLLFAGAKVVEEAKEVLGAALVGDRRRTIQELADLKDAMGEVQHLSNITDSEIELVRYDKIDRLGVFRDGVLQREVLPQDPQS